jgi:SPP1 gp7 family putative phage head morphogenesis protein
MPLHFNDEQIDDLIKGLFNGSVTSHDLPEDLYFAIAEHLKDGLYKGFGGQLKDFPADSVDRELLEKLRENIYMFSGAKTYQQVLEMRDALTNEDGRVATFKEFRDTAADIFDKYNQNWLRTEYDTAIGQAQSAAHWSEIETKKGVLPFLKYSAIEDENTSEICAPLDGVCLPVDDDFWSIYMPLNHFNCRCTVEQLPADEAEPTSESGIKEAKDATAEAGMRDEFKMNPGKDGYVFSPEHPYFDVAPQDRTFAENNFDLPIPPPEVEIPAEVFTEASTLKEAEAFAKNTLETEFTNYKGVALELANQMNERLFMHRQIFPELKLNGLGAAQEMNRALKADFAKEFAESKIYKDTEARAGKAYADKLSKKWQNAIASPVQENVSAFSFRPHISSKSGERFEFPRYNGVYANVNQAKSAESYAAQKERSLSRNWLVPNAGSMRGTMDHELGHELDNLLGIKENPAFMEIFKREHAGGVKALADKLSTYGATAGGNRAHLRHEMIAEAWSEFFGATAPRPLAKEIGELILNEYYLKYKQGTGTTYKLWREKIIKK